MARLHRPSAKAVLAAVVSVTFGIIVGLIAAHLLREVFTWKPLYGYEQQIVKSQGPLVPSSSSPDAVVPQVKLGSKVIVTGTKSSREKVVVDGHSPDWTSVVPGGFYYRGPDRAGLRLKGTLTQTFENDIPPEVDAWAREQIKKGRRPEVYMSGCEVPVDGQRRGQEACWTTGRFVLVLP